LSLEELHLHGVAKLKPAPAQSNDGEKELVCRSVPDIVSGLQLVSVPPTPQT
jgi:hypothetical protein